MKFGDWTVIERDYHPTSTQHSTFWFCKCGICGNTYSVSRDSLIRGQSGCCNKCKGEKIRQKLIEKDLVSWRKGDRFGLLEIIDRAEPKGKHTYVKCKCDCGNIVNIRLEHLRGQGHNHTISCGCASQSSGEIKLTQLLKQANIDFQTQYRIQEFNICAPFDFAIFNNGKLLGLIEYDGQQHFEPVEFWGGEKQLKNQQERDKNKNDWCKNNNIRLIRIPYTDYDKITVEYLKKYFPEI